jgi:integrase
VSLETPWTYTVGLLPHRVVAYEDPARKGVVYLKWRASGDWRRKSLGYTVRTEKGKLDKAATERAAKAADAQYQRLVTGGVLAPAPTAELTLAEGWALAIDPDGGRWNKDTAHRREMTRAINRAKSILGAATPWNVVGRAELRKLWRAELRRCQAKGLAGVRSAEILVSRFLTVANWLRDEQRIAPTACVAWRSMWEEFQRDANGDRGPYEAKRPRYTPDEYRLLLKTAPEIDPRWGLLLTLGAEYRLGQVVRARRSHANLERGLVTIAGAGKKRGTTIALTAGQRAALTEALERGYLAGLEAARVAGEITDFPLFPGVRLPRQDGAVVTEAKHADRPPLNAFPLRKWLRATEAKAEIPHVDGRGWYGLRRAAVDAAKAAGISREGLQQHGGWSDTQVPDAIYADREATYARDEATRIRAQIRGEVDVVAD